MEEFMKATVTAYHNNTFMDFKVIFGSRESKNNIQTEI